MNADYLADVLTWLAFFEAGRAYERAAVGNRQQLTDLPWPRPRLRLIDGGKSATAARRIRYLAG